MPFLLTEILNYQGSAHLFGVGSFSYLLYSASSSFLKYRMQYYYEYYQDDWQPDF